MICFKNTSTCMPCTIRTSHWKRYTFHTTTWQTKLHC